MVVWRSTQNQTLIDMFHLAFHFPMACVNKPASMPRGRANMLILSDKHIATNPADHPQYFAFSNNFRGWIALVCEIERHHCLLGVSFSCYGTLLSFGFLFFRWLSYAQDDVGVTKWLCICIYVSRDARSIEVNMVAQGETDTINTATPHKSSFHS